MQDSGYVRKNKFRLKFDALTMVLQPDSRKLSAFTFRRGEAPKQHERRSRRIGSISHESIKPRKRALLAFFRFHHEM